MPQVSADVHVPVPPDLAFAVSQTTGAVRRRWDPWLQPLAHPIGQWLLGREITRRIEGFAAGCRDEVVLAAARADTARRAEAS